MTCTTVSTQNTIDPHRNTPRAPALASGEHRPPRQRLLRNRHPVYQRTCARRYSTCKPIPDRRSGLQVVALSYSTDVDVYDLQADFKAGRLLDADNVAATLVGESSSSRPGYPPDNTEGPLRLPVAANGPPCLTFPVDLAQREVRVLACHSQSLSPQHALPLKGGWPYCRPFFRNLRCSIDQDFFRQPIHSAQECRAQSPHLAGSVGGWVRRPRRPCVPNCTQCNGKRRRDHSEESHCQLQGMVVRSTPRCVM